jgi:hypothetical protein
MRGESLSQNAILNPRRNKAPSATSCARQPPKNQLEGAGQKACVSRMHLPHHTHDANAQASKGISGGIACESACSITSDATRGRHCSAHLER